MAPVTARSTRSLTRSSHPRMPHVFVIPPEEEQQENPPWCCFDADEQPENSGDFPSNPDIHFLDVPYLLHPSEHPAPAPIPRRSSVRPQRPRAPVLKKLEKKQRPEAIKIIEHGSPSARQKEAREDSDVIEVVKVKRTREALVDLEENTKIKRSKTLKARATKALQSIKNVGKGSHKTHVKELWTSPENMPGISKGVQEQIRSQQNQTENRPPHSSSKKTLSRGNSRSLSNILQPTKPLRSESTFTVRVETSVTLADVPPASIPSSPDFKYNDTNPSLIEVPVMPDRPASPIPFMKKNVTARFSVRELHRLFSFSSSSPDPPSTPSATTGAFSSAPSNFMPSASTCTLSSDNLDVPTEEDVDVDAHLLDLGNANRKPSSRQTLDTYDDDDWFITRRPRDLSFEMQLDSLHFDALSFDPEDFDVSMEGNVLR